MSGPRQQRTLSRRRFDPGQGPLPILIPLPAAAFISSTFLRLQFPVPVIVRGLPPIMKPGGIMPSVCTIVDEQTIELEYLGGTQPGEVYELAEWTPTIRGLNGEWITPGSLLVGGGPGGGLPLVSVVLGVLVSGTNDLIWTFDDAIENIGAACLKANGADALSYATIGGNQLLATYFDPVYSGYTFSVTPWDPLSYDTVAGKWVGGCSGLVQ